jgi:hypothetical protein
MSPQFLQQAVRVVIFLTGCFAATAAYSQDEAPIAPSPPQPIELSEASDPPATHAKADTFVIGDWYKIRAKRRGASAQCSGTLVKANEQWIVLRTISEGRNEFAVPVVSKVPVVGRLFKNVGIGRIDENTWIPRDAAAIEEQTTVAQQVELAEAVVQASTFSAEEKMNLVKTAQARAIAQAPTGDEPPKGRLCQLDLAGGKGAEQDSGDVVAITDEAISLMVTRNVAVTTRLPLVGELPLVGGAFSRTTTEVRKERRQIDRANVLCVRVSNHGQAAMAVADLEPAPSEEAAPIAPAPPKGAPAPPKFAPAPQKGVK